jgi:predicted transcriptional regulator
MTSTTTLKLDDSMKERIKRLAEGRKRTSHWLMREAISEYVTREEKRDSFYQDALASLEHYNETGLHITLDELEVWFNSLGTEHEVDMPECHT